MPTIPRSVARQCRALFRRLSPSRSPRTLPGKFGLLSGSDGIRLRYGTGEAIIEYHHPGDSEALQASLPLDLLSECEGRGQEPISFTLSPEGQMTVWWQQGSIPHARDYPHDEKVPEMPERPDQGSTNGPELLDALEHAFEVAGKDQVRYALDHVVLRGGRGEVVATDGRQLLVEGGFKFDWDGDVLIPRSPVFAELPRAESVTVARTGEHVFFKVGQWTLAFRIAKGARFPNVEAVIPSANSASTTWRLPSKEARTLTKALADLPGARDEHAPVTLDLNGKAIVRAKEEGRDQPTELILFGPVEGKPIRMATDRTYLGRALKMGFDTLAFAGSEKPIVCRKGSTSTYLWLPLSPESVIAAHPGALKAGDGLQLRIRSGSASRKKVSGSAPTNGNGHPKEPHHDSRPGFFGSLWHGVQEVMALVREHCDQDRWAA